MPTSVCRGVPICAGAPSKDSPLSRAPSPLLPGRSREYEPIAVHHEGERDGPLTQEQRSYRLDLPVRVRYAGGKADIFNWHIEGDTPTHVIETAEKPADVSLNDDLTSLVVLRVQSLST
jgi:hypothetical protein